MNQENKFEQIKEKLLHCWAVVVAACGRFLEYVKVNGGAVLENLAAWAAGVWEKLRTLFGQAVDWVQTTAARLTAGKDTPAEGLSESEELWELPDITQDPEEDPVPAALQEPEEAADPAALPVMEIAEQAEAEAPRTVPVQEETSWLSRTGAVLTAVGGGIRLVIKWIWKLRKVFMAIPVIWAAVKIAMENLDRLPEKVGLDIQSTGEFARMITREEAVWWPFGITMFCLLLMFCSKKPILPWVISIFTLVLPWLIWILNYYA